MAVSPLSIPMHLSEPAVGRGLLSDALHQLLQALDTGLAGEDECCVIRPVGVFLVMPHIPVRRRLS